jgi:ectoine hydroxylase-related dioxygenase (phytanoyl-CoA dioxygenase family)
MTSTSSVAALDAVLPTQQDVAFYREHGWWISDVIVPDDVLDAAERGMHRFHEGERDHPAPDGLEALGWTKADGGGLRKNDYASLLNDELADLVRTPAIGAVAARLSGANGIRLWHDQLLFKPVDDPSRPANVGWHTDRQYWESCTSVEMLTAWVPFHDVDEQGGTITFLDGSHRWDHAGLDFGSMDLAAQEEQLRAEGREIRKVPANLKRGQVSFHHCLTIHGSGPNHSDAPRRSLAIHLQPADNRFQRVTARNGEPAEHYSDPFARRDERGEPDYTDPRLFPSLFG